MTGFPGVVAQRVVDEVALAISIRVGQRVRGKRHGIGLARAAARPCTGAPIGGQRGIRVGLRGDQDQAVSESVGARSPRRLSS